MSAVVQMEPPTVDVQQAARFLHLLDETAESWCFRTFDDKGRGAGRTYAGALEELDVSLRIDNGKARGVFVVVNEGGQSDADITRVRAVFADFDGTPLPDQFPIEPHIIVESSPGKYHVYWRVDGLPLAEFKPLQQRIAAMLGTDPAVCNPSRVMRLPGFVHHKGDPFVSRIIHESGALPYAPERVLAAFPVLEATTLRQAPAAGTGERVVDVERHGDLLKLAARFARHVHFDGLAESSALAALCAEDARGRWTREMPADEIRRAFEGALDKCRRGEWKQADRPGDGDGDGDTDTDTPRLADTIARLLVPMSDAELEASRAPHPHVFQAGERGLFPLGEVSEIGARGREGKTTVVVGVAVAVAIEHSIARLNPPERRSVVIYSAEDDRRQYARKVAAQCSLLGAHHAGLVKRRILVPELDTPDMAAVRALVTVADRNPIPTGTDTALIEALAPLMASAEPPILLVFETASTLSDAEEDTRGHKLLIACLKRVARALNVAVVLVHHTSQAADNHLPDLAISTADIRGGTALVYNSRQNLMLVNLGSDADPFPDTDARTVLRGLAGGGEDGRITALITLDSSKGMDPAPVFFRWVQTDFGPAAVEQESPLTLAGKPWRKVREMVMAERGNVRTEARSNAQGASVTQVVALVEKLHKAGKQPTARAVSVAAGKSPTWAKPYLESAVDEGLLSCGREPIPRMKDGGSVYRPADSTAVAA